MAEAERRQRDESEGMSSLLISLPSSRSVCSLEKLVTSVKAQKLPRVNSEGGGEDVSIVDVVGPSITDRDWGVCTFDPVGLQVEVLQRRAHGGDSLQPVEAQVQLHQAGHIEGVGGDALVSELVVRQPDILELGQTAQEALWEGVDGVVLHVELVHLSRERVWDLGGHRRLGAEQGGHICKGMMTFVNWLLLMSSIMRDFRAFREVPMSLMALSWRYRTERWSIPSKSATATCE